MGFRASAWDFQIPILSPLLSASAPASMQTRSGMALSSITGGHQGCTVTQYLQCEKKSRTDSRVFESSSFPVPMFNNKVYHREKPLDDSSATLDPEFECVKCFPWYLIRMHERILTCACYHKEQGALPIYCMSFCSTWSYLRRAVDIETPGSDPLFQVRCCGHPEQIVERLACPALKTSRCYLFTD